MSKSFLFKILFIIKYDIKKCTKQKLQLSEWSQMDCSLTTTQVKLLNAVNVLNLLRTPPSLQK